MRLVPVFEEGVERGVLSEVGLDGGDSLRDEVVEPAVGQNLVDPVNATLHEDRYRHTRAPPNRPFGLFARGG